MRDQQYKNRNMTLKIKLSPMAWRNSAPTPLPRACCWSVKGQRRKLVLRQSRTLVGDLGEAGLTTHASEVAEGQLSPCPLAR